MTTTITIADVAAAELCSREEDRSDGVALSEARRLFEALDADAALSDELTTVLRRILVEEVELRVSAMREALDTSDVECLLVESQRAQDVCGLII